MSDENQTPPRRPLVHLYAAPGGRWKAYCGVSGKPCATPNAAIASLVHTLLLTLEARSMSLVGVVDIQRNYLYISAAANAGQPGPFYYSDLTAFFLDPQKRVRAAEAFLFRSDRQANA